VTNIEIQNTLENMIQGDAPTIYANAERLKYVSPLVNFDALGGKYCQATESAEHQALADTYLRYTGETIERIDFHICEDW
jgi:hypothetical protein